MLCSLAAQDKTLSTHYRFPAEARLHKPEEFAHALKGNRLGRTLWFYLTCAPALHSASEPRPRLGVALSKRLAKRAITRNTLKRVAREHFRLRQYHLAPGDYVIRLRAPIPSDLSLRALRNELNQQFNTLWTEVIEGKKCHG